MKLVSENDPQEIEAERAERAVVRSLRALASNIMRCAAGGGQDYLLEDQAEEFLLAVRARRDGAGAQPLNASYHLAASTALKDHRDWVEDPYQADSSIRDAALQVHASYLLDQSTQVANAEIRLHDALRAAGYKRVRFSEP